MSVILAIIAGCMSASVLIRTLDLGAQIRVAAAVIQCSALFWIGFRLAAVAYFQMVA